MISKLGSVVNSESTARIRSNCKKVCLYAKSEWGHLNESKTVVNANQKLKDSANILLKRIKNTFRNLNKFINEHFSEAGRSKKAGMKPLEGEDLTKFIRDTEIYDPNSPSYIHGNYSIPKNN